MTGDIERGDVREAVENFMLLSGGGVNDRHSVIASELDRVEEETRVRISPGVWKSE